MSSPDDHRSSNVKGLKYQSALNMLAMLLPGATLSYYGEEIGLLEMVPDDEAIAKYTSQMGRAVCPYLQTDICSEIIVIWYKILTFLGNFVFLQLLQALPDICMFPQNAVACV